MGWLWSRRCKTPSYGLTSDERCCRNLQRVCFQLAIYYGNEQNKSRKPIVRYAPGTSAYRFILCYPFLVPKRRTQCTVYKATVFHRVSRIRTTSHPKPKRPDDAYPRHPDLSLTSSEIAHRIGASSQYLSNCASAAFHSLTNASVSCVTDSASGIRPPHISGRAACARAYAGMRRSVCVFANTSQQ